MMATIILLWQVAMATAKSIIRPSLLASLSVLTGHSHNKAIKGGVIRGRENYASRDHHDHISMYQGQRIAAYMSALLMREARPKNVSKIRSETRNKNVTKLALGNRLTQIQRGLSPCDTTYLTLCAPK